MLPHLGRALSKHSCMDGTREYITMAIHCNFARTPRTAISMQQEQKVRVIVDAGLTGSAGLATGKSATSHEGLDLTEGTR